MTAAIKQSNKKNQCWAHTLNGKRCPVIVSSREGEPIPVPYCNIHLKSGDGALKVVNHPLAGKCLVARYDLPKGYRIAFWGMRGQCLNCDVEDRAISFYPPNPISGSNRLVEKKPGWRKNGKKKITEKKTNTSTTKKIITRRGTSRIRVDNYNGVLNPIKGDLVQFAACPGPGERQNMRSTFQYWGMRNGLMGGLEFVTLEQVPRNTQLCHWYGSGWWGERGLKRMDVGTTMYPAPRRKNREAYK